MSHNAQVNFCRQLRKSMPLKFVETSVLDVGSLDVNGSNRWMFAHCTYLGIDLVAGKGVDRVGTVFDVEGEFGVVISTEALEHDPEWRTTLGGMAAKVKSGGLLVITCGGPGRPEHGTRRFPIPGMGNDTDYYQNISPHDLLANLPMDQFADYAVHFSGKICDTYFWGVRR